MDVGTLSAVMNHRLSEARYRELLPPMENAMRMAEINNLPRASMWMAHIGHESMDLQYMEEIADGSAYNGRGDLGNIYPGDGPRFKGRGPIQLTGRVNYRAFTAWTRRTGQSDIDFEANPHLLSEPHWGFLAAAYYWVVARPDINALSDNRDVTRVTHRINGGENGLQDRINRFNRAWNFGNKILPSGGEPEGRPRAVEKVLQYSRAWIRQDTFYWCGPATCQTIILSKNGNLIPEGTLASQLGTTVNGTDYVGYLARVLNQHIGGGYKVIDISNDPPTRAQVDEFWANLIGSINAGYGMALNFIAPPSNYPRGSHGSISPAYSGGTVYHYVAAMGYARESNGSRHVWIADSGFAPYGYWATLEQIVSIVAGKGYAYPAEAAVNKSIDDEELTVDQAKFITDFIKGYVAPIISDVKDIRQQLTGGRDAGEYPGWEQLGKDAQGRNLTMVDAIGANRRDTAAVNKKVEELAEEVRKLKGGK